MFDDKGVGDEDELTQTKGAVYDVGWYNLHASKIKMFHTYSEQVKSSKSTDQYG